MMEEEFKERVTKRVEKAVRRSWHGLGDGGVVTNMVGCHGHVHLYVWPALREVVGGPQDGSVCYPKFSFDVTRFGRYFDNIPHYAFTNVDMAPTLMVFGNIMGVQFHVCIHSVPPPEAIVNEKLHVCGSKAGQIERILNPPETDEEF